MEKNMSEIWETVKDVIQGYLIGGLIAAVGIGIIYAIGMLWIYLH